MFQHTAARRRLGTWRWARYEVQVVSTHSRPKAAGWSFSDGTTEIVVSTHSRPKAAGIAKGIKDKSLDVSTHSRPKAAGGGY